MIDALTLRDQIAGIIMADWPFTIPILWENMPPPSPLPDQGWVKIQIRFGKRLTSGLGRVPVLQRGYLQMRLAVHEGEGMQISDAMVSHIMTRFDQKQLADIHFGQANVQSPTQDDGVVITAISIRFHAKLS